MSAHVRQVAGLFPSARRETKAYWKPFKGDFKIGGNPVKRIGGALKDAGKDVGHVLSEVGEGVVNIVGSPYYHFADKPNTGWSYGWKQLAGSAPTLATMAIVTAYGINAVSTPGGVPPAGDTPYANLPGSVDMPYGADYAGMPTTPPAPTLLSADFPNPELAGGSIDMPYGVNYPGADLSPSWTATALSAGKYVGEKIALPLALKLLTPSPAVASKGGGYSIYNQAGGTDGGGSGSPGGGGGFFSGFDEPGALGLPAWATYVIAALALGVAITAVKRKG